MVSIGIHKIGPGQRAFIIAEAGVNHDGDVNKAFQLIDAAAAAGANAVKFQVFRAEELVTASAPTATYQLHASGESSQRQMLAQLELGDAALRQLVDHARARHITFLATPFSVGDVARLLALGVSAIKTASTDLTNRSLQSAVLQTNLPLIVSTGAATESEIRESVEWMSECGAQSRLILMHCVSAYPTPIETANLRAIRALEDAFHVPVGFSDHTLSVHAGAWAVCAGAALLEKHLTLDRQTSGPDHSMSLDPVMLAEYVRAVRIAEAAMGTGRLGMQAIEAEVRAIARRSIVSACSIPRGTLLTPEMLTIKRPDGGLAPECLPSLVGRKAARDIQGDSMLSWDMLH